MGFSGCIYGDVCKGDEAVCDGDGGKLDRAVEQAGMSAAKVRDVSQ